MAEVRSVNGKRVASPEYRAWQAMKNRCLNPKSQDYKYYGGRGIELCSEWRTFAGFLADMGRKPDPSYTLERIDSNGNYEPRNCVWATRLEQSRNREYASVRVWELAAKLGVSKGTAYHYVWQIRKRDREGADFCMQLSSEREAEVREAMKEICR
jgi:hypothetical protein